MADAPSDFSLPSSYDVVTMRPLPKKMRRFFYEHIETGNVIDLTEQQAAVMLKNGGLRNMRLLGSSDGSAAIEVYKACGYRPGQLVPIDIAQKTMRDAYAAEVEAARAGPKKRPIYRGKYLDGSVYAHENAESIINGLGGRDAVQPMMQGDA